MTIKMPAITCLLILVTVAQLNALNPVLMVPGDGGSIIMARYTRPSPHYICGSGKSWFVLWLNLFYFTPLTLDCFVHTVKLEYDPITRTTSDPDFCETKVDGFGTSDAVEYFSGVRIKPTSYFHYVIEDLVNNLGYVPNKSLRGAPYDFRKAPNEMSDFQNDMQRLIEEMFVENLNSPVIIMAHSMGNLYVLRLLQAMTQQWKEKYIKSFISISAPYSGAVDAIRTALSGNNEHISILSPLDLRMAQSTWPSTYLLMPVPSLWSSDNIVLTEKGNYRVQSLSTLLESSGIRYAKEHLKDVSDTIIDRGAPNVPVFCIYTVDMPTPEVLDYRNRNFPDSVPSITFGSGDGTVNLQSLQHCTNWQRQQNEPVITFLIPGVKHLHIMRDSRLVERVSKIIENSKI